MVGVLLMMPSLLGWDCADHHFDQVDQIVRYYDSIHRVGWVGDGGWWVGFDKCVVGNWLLDYLNVKVVPIPDMPSLEQMVAGSVIE